MGLNAHLCDPRAVLLLAVLGYNNRQPSVPALVGHLLDAGDILSVMHTFTYLTLTQSHERGIINMPILL